MPLDQTINEIPQAQTEGIARRLMGDDLVDRYGDVIGARKTGPADVLRDFTLGMQQGSSKVDELHMKVQQQFESAYNKSATQALEQKKADIAKMQAVIGAIKTVQGLPPGHRAGILKDTLDQAGIPYTPSAIKMFTDSDVLAQLPLGDMEDRVNDGTLTTEHASGVFGSALNAAKFVSEAARKKRETQQTNNMVLQAEQTRVRNQDARLRLARDKQMLPLSIKNAKLRGKVMEKALDKNSGGITGIPQIDEALRNAATGMPTATADPNAGAAAPPLPASGQNGPTTPSQAQPLAQPAAGSNLDAVKQRLRLK